MFALTPSVVQYEESVSRLPELESYIRMPLPTRATEYKGHAIFGLLHGENMIESYEVFKRSTDDTENSNVLVALVKFGDRLDGHPGVVHGGILSLVLDDALGFGYEAIGVEKAVTANLNINYRTPVPAGATVRVAAQLDHREGRKIYWTAQITSLDKSIIYVEATSLYIIPRPVASSETPNSE